MSNDTPQLPNPNAVSELRDLYSKRKKDRFKKHKDFAEILKKKTPLKKIAKPIDLTDAGV